MNTEAKLVVGSTGIEIPLNCDSFRIGRSLDCNHVIAEKIVSRCHCVVQKIGDRLWNICDKSTNGTIVNGVLIKRMESECLKDGDEIVLNNYHERFIFRLAVRTNDLDSDQVNEESIIDEQLNMLADEIEKGNGSQEHANIKRMKLNDGTAIVVTCCNSSSAPMPDSVASNTDVFVNNLSNKQETEQELNNEERREESSNKSSHPQETNNEDAEKLENELVCSICSELFIKAVTLNCSHTYCKYCIEMWRQRQNGCPICRVKITSVNPTLVLDNVIDQVCSTYTEVLKEHRKEVLEQRKQMELANPIPQTSKTNIRSQSITISSASDNSSQSTHTDNDSNDGWNDDDDDDIYSTWHSDNDDDDDDWHFSEAEYNPNVSYIVGEAVNSERIAEAAEREVEMDMREVEINIRVAERSARIAERNARVATRNAGRLGEYTALAEDDFGSEIDWNDLGNDYGRLRWGNQGRCFSCNQFGHYARNCPYTN